MTQRLAAIDVGYAACVNCTALSFAAVHAPRMSRLIVCWPRLAEEDRQATTNSGNGEQESLTVCGRLMTCTTL